VVHTPLVDKEKEKPGHGSYTDVIASISRINGVVQLPDHFPFNYVYGIENCIIRQT
jgi:hypothetical protein